MSNANAQPPKQLLHLVFGGELESLDGVQFRNLDKLDIIGIYPKKLAEKALGMPIMDRAFER